MRRFDAVIIGAGQAGPSLAGRLTAAGMTVALVERKLFGGTCVNTGCTPTKTMVASAYAAHLARRAFAQASLHFFRRPQTLAGPPPGSRLPRSLAMSRCGGAPNSLL
jgi:pyruvate/2-oxoglutarate dehydrogenase complex dihydrolipoamide dehydrogenase (E3) component